MSKSLRGRLFAAIFSAGAATAIAAPAAAETLADALAIAYDSNPVLQAQRATQRALDENYVQARSGWRPTVGVSLSGTFTETRNPSTDLPFPVDLNQDGIPDTQTPGFTRRTNFGSYNISFSQPIWTGGRVAASVSATTSDIMQGRENLRRVESQVMGQVIQAYTDVRRDIEGLRIRERNVTVLQQQLKESQARFDVGEITRTDVAQSQSRLAAATALLQSAQAQLAISRANYAAAVGQNPGTLAPEPSLAFLLPPSVDEAFTVAEAYNPLLRAQQFAEQASRARVAGARAERMPTVSISGSYGSSNVPIEPFRLGNNARTGAIGATVSIPLFNGGLTTSRIRQTIERNNTDRITIETQRRTVLQQVTQSWNQLIAARANISSTAEQVRAAQIAAEGTRQELQVGLRTTLDVLNAEQELRNAELSQVQASHDEYVAAASVLSAMGRLEAKNLLPTVAQYDSKANFRKLRVTWGWVPWEEVIAPIDRAIALPPAPQPQDKPVEKAIPPGLQPPPIAPPAPAAAAKPASSNPVDWLKSKF